MMMMIACITINSGLVPLIEGLCAQIYCLRNRHRDRPVTWVTNRISNAPGPRVNLSGSQGVQVVPLLLA